LKFLIRQSECKGHVVIHKAEGNTEFYLRAKEGCVMELLFSDWGEELGCYRKFTEPKSHTKEVTLLLSAF
jgi:hypothetical protein